MANIRQIKGRIKSAKNISQITKAMELVAASKMKKAQAAATAGKLYAQKIYRMVLELGSSTDVSEHPLLVKPKVVTGKRLVLVVSTNKGLCGGLNTNLLRFLTQTISQPEKQDYVAIGKKGAQFLARMGYNLKADFSEQAPFTGIIPALTDLVTQEYVRGGYDGVDIVYNEFVSALKQIPRKKAVLPLTIEPTGEEVHTESPLQFVVEPSAKEVFDALLPHYLENQIRDVVLQSEASEHSARMVAMRNATDNAKAFIQELTLIYNKARQEKITYEITDMVTARSAVE